MLRLGAAFIVVCMVLIAGSFGAVLYLVFGLGGPESTVVALAGLTALALYNAVTTKLRDRADLSGQIADLSRGTADLARQVAEHSRRIGALEVPDHRFAEKTAIGGEPGELGTRLKQLADTVASHEAALHTLAVRRATADTPANAATDPNQPESRPLPEAPPFALRPGPEALAETIRKAIEANRADLYLQPIVTLPQRKVRYYEALTRLRTEDGTVLQPADFLDPAEAAGLMPQIDHASVTRCVQVLRRLQLKNRELGLFCNIAASTLSDTLVLPEIVQYMEANRALGPSLVFELRQSAWDALGLRQMEALAALRELGFRFGMDNLTSLRLEPAELGERGIRFVKVPASLLLGRSATESHEFSERLSRFGISLIVERIETEAQVVDLLDHDIRFAQGFLFSPPRPVRAEALQASSASDTPSDAADKAAASAGLA